MRGVLWVALDAHEPRLLAAIAAQPYRARAGDAWIVARGAGGTKPKILR